MDLKTRINSIEERIAQATAQMARLQVAAETAAARKAELMDTLKSEFGVTSIEEAEELEKKISKAVEAGIEKAEEELRQSE